MKQHRNIVLVSPALDAQEIARYAEMFADQSPGWMFPVEQSVNNGVKSFIVHVLAK